MTGVGPEGESTLASYLPHSASRLQSLFERLDPAFAGVWATHASRLLGRTVLDARTRFLVLTGQYTVTRMTPQLEENLEAGLAGGVEAAELLEVILQCYVYTGPWVVEEACQACVRVLERAGTALPRSSGETVRSLDEERESWADADRDDPRLAHLLDRYGWHGISTGLRLRPGHHINLLDTLDALDPEFLQGWLDAVYDGMYSRHVLDDRTRLLCVVGATLALGEGHQSRRHMRAALRSGAAPRELLEVIFHTTAIFGHPYVMPAAIDDLIRILDDEDRLDELVESPRSDDILRIAQARAARRGGVHDDLSRS
jgi:alkylhydroperoxidase/carboxymuconolactone decarboxylase family protein YurZ